MLTIFTGGGSRTCDGLSRRDFLRVGTLGVGATAMGGATLSNMLALRAYGAEKKESFVRDKSIVFLYLSGGASHIETFDPKMSAPSEVRSMTGETATKIPGVTFGGTFTGMAARADKMAVVRSFQHPVGDHVQAHVHVLTGGLSTGGKEPKPAPSMGSMVSRLRGTNHPTTGLPSYCLITEEEVDGQYSNERGRIALGSSPASLGIPYAPFAHTTGAAGNVAKPRNNRDGGKNQSGSLAANMTLHLPTDRFSDRQLLLEQLDRINRRMDAHGSMQGFDKFNAQAANVMLGGAADAFDFRKEPKSLIEKYDTSHTKVGHKVFRPSTIGHQFLVARRLCEAGAGFVTIHSAGWDMHNDGNNPGILKGMGMLGTTLDQAVSAFLDDLAERGMSDKVLLVITGDFGRTPKVNARGGRDHWSKICTLALAGGGWRMGQAIGQSTRGADAPESNPVTLANLMATIMHTSFDVGKLRLDAGVPRDLLRLIETGQPIQEL